MWSEFIERTEGSIFKTFKAIYDSVEFTHFLQFRNAYYILKKDYSP